MKQDGLILWILAGTGVLFIYAAYKNVTPQSLIFGHVNGGVEAGTDTALSHYKGSGSAPSKPAAQSVATAPKRPTATGGLVSV